MNWQDFESNIRDLASIHWASKAVPETINGVRFDCVIKWRSDYWIIIEVSLEESLEKLRKDISKFSAVKPFLITQEIYAECYFVCRKPTEQMRITGEGNKLRVMSVDELRGKLLGYDEYYNLRSKRPFGSAIDRVSGEPDTSEYIHVEYKSADGKRSYTFSDVAGLLSRGEKIVLLGDYGTGKSRCIQETFFYLHNTAVKEWKFPISIDLRESWGVRRGKELLRRHFDDLGLPKVGESALRLLSSKRLIILIDGFDEIASQTWSYDSEVLKSIRRKSLSAVSDLLKQVNCGFLITGRDHYFNSTDEMYQCLGLNPNGTHVLRCSHEFTESQTRQYLQRLKGMSIVPEWLPKRPLTCQILADLEPNVLQDLITKETGEVRFWSAAIRAICEREASIRSILDADVINDVLVGLARLTRTKPKDLGPLSTREINDVFNEVTGIPPTDESAVILQRLPLLGRVKAETSDRRFVDYYFLDGLRAEDVCREVFKHDEAILTEKWLNPLRSFGIRILTHEISVTADLSGFIRFLRRACTGSNKVLGGDLVSGILNVHEGTFDFGGIMLSDSHISFLDVSNGKFSGIEIFDSIIDEINITGANPTNVRISRCLIQKVDGVSEAAGLPKWLVGNDVGEFVRVNTVTRIKQAKLSSEQKVFVTIIKKTFFQPGSGRKEEALLRGMDSNKLKRSGEKILKMLIREGMLKTAPGKEGQLYIPQRAYTRRMAEILKELTLSQDELWQQLNPTD